MLKSLLRATSVASGLVLLSGAAFADEAPYEVITKFRGIGTFPNQTLKFQQAPINSNTGVSTNKVFDHGIGAELSATYFYNTNVASEIGVGFYGQKFKSFKGVSDLYSNTASPSTKAKRSFFVPVTATVQYHVNPGEEFAPYVGAGWNYTIPTNSSHMAKVSNLHGPVVQAGLDLFSKDDYGFNVDVKKMWNRGHIKYSAPVTSTPVKAKYRADPVVVGFGVTWRM